MHCLKLGIIKGQYLLWCASTIDAVSSGSMLFIEILQNFIGLIDHQCHKLELCFPYYESMRIENDYNMPTKSMHFILQAAVV